MTQIQDLRIGNLVLSAKQVCTVTGLSKGTVEVNSNEWGSESAFDPIPLAEQILLDSGFAKLPKDTHDYSVKYIKWVNNEDCFYAELIDEKWWRFYIGDLQIPCHETKDVHDLQNTYYMATGQQLNIVIK